MDRRKKAHIRKIKRGREHENERKETKIKGKQRLIHISQLLKKLFKKLLEVQAKCSMPV